MGRQYNKGDVDKLSAEIPSDIMKSFRSYAKAHKRSMTDIVRECVEHIVVGDMALRGDFPEKWESEKETCTEARNVLSDTDKTIRDAILLTDDTADVRVMKAGYYLDELLKAQEQLGAAMQVYQQALDGLAVAGKDKKS